MPRPKLYHRRLLFELRTSWYPVLNIDHSTTGDCLLMRILSFHLFSIISATPQTKGLKLSQSCLDYISLRWDVVYFDQQTHTCACVRMVKNDKKAFENEEKVPFLSCARGSCKTHEEKSLLVSDWEWLPKAGCSFGFLLFFFMRLTWASCAHDEKGTFFIILDHANACTSWSKYTTVGVFFCDDS